MGIEPATQEDASPSRLVTSQKDGRVAVFTLDDPPANTYTHQMMLDLDRCILDARFDPDVDVIIIEGKGEKFFCAGANINMLAKADPVWKYYFCLHANETLLRLEHTPKLVIAALQGHCVGGGLEVALACDIRIGARASGKVGLPEVQLGVMPATGGTQRLARLIGKSKAIELMCEGKTFDYDRALQEGIVNKVFDNENFSQQVREYAKSFAGPAKAAMAVGHIKRACQSGAEVSLEQGLAFERELQAKLFNSADAVEGLNAYVEKRKAQFEGK